MSIRTKLNQTIEKIPIIGGFLASEISPRNLALTALATLCLAGPANAARVSIEEFFGAGSNQGVAQSVAVTDAKGWVSLTKRLDGFGRIINTADLNNENAVSPTYGWGNLNYEVLGNERSKLDVLAGAEFISGRPLDPRVGAQFTFADKGFLFYGCGTYSLNPNPTAKIKYDVGYTGPMSAGFGGRINLEQAFTLPYNGPATNITRLRLGATWEIPSTKAVISGGLGLDVNNFQNGPKSPVNPRVVLIGAYLSGMFQ